MPLLATVIESMAVLVHAWAVCLSQQWAHLCGTGLAAAPAADKVDRRDALRAARHVCGVQVGQLVLEAAAGRLGTRRLHSQQLLGNEPALSCLPL